MGQATNEFFYSDVVNLASEVDREQTSLLSDCATETTYFRFVVSSGDPMQFVVTDHDVASEINRRIEAKRKQDAETDTDGVETPAEAEPPEDSFDPALLGTVAPDSSLAKSILAFIRPNLRQHHLWSQPSETL